VTTQLENLSFLLYLVFFVCAANLLVKNARKNKFVQKNKKNFCEKIKTRKRKIKWQLMTDSVIAGPVIVYSVY
jgi:membrane-anchored glycerophosphoryl diester phosphodiesterase (GDPDase)